MRKLLLMMVIVFLMGVPTLAQDEIPADGPTLFDEIGDFVIEADLLNWTVLLVAILFLGMSVPQSYIDKQIIAAKASDTPIDDIVWQVLAELNKLKMADDEIIPEAAVASVSKDSYADMLTPINGNSDLSQVLPIYLTFDGKNVDCPDGWVYYYVLGEANQHPQILKVAGGYSMLFDQQSGNFGFEQTLKLEGGQRYRVDVDVMANFEAYLHCSVYNDHAQENLEPFLMSDGLNYSSWAIDPVPATDDYHVRVWVNAPENLLEAGSVLTWRKIAIVKDDA